jgi:hypothetical protein
MNNKMTKECFRKSNVMAGILVLFLMAWGFPSHNALAAAGSKAFKTYTDPLKRFSIKFPATMKVEEPNPDEIRIYHPNATFRINISIENRLKKGPPDATAFIKAFKQNLKLETKQPEILKEGSSKNIKGAQAYLIYAFTDKRGIRLMQLCQYYATEDRFLQLIITDRIEGFRNLEKIITEIHESFKILKPNLQ